MKNFILRTLHEEDAIGMLEWMQDKEINQLLHFDATKITLDTCKNFIKNAQENKENIHFAITDDTNEYLGTVSLKNIDRENRSAEFAIAVRKTTMGTGASFAALEQILKYGFEKIGLNRIYLYVRTDNLRAVKFYEKYFLRLEGTFLQYYCINEVYKDIRWYAILKDEYSEWRAKNNLE